MFDHILVLHRFARNYLDRLLADLDDADLAVQHYPGQNPPGWILGHLALVADFTLGRLDQPAHCPPGWRRQFGPQSQPSANRADYPSLAELRQLLNTTYEALTQAVPQADPQRLAQPNPVDMIRADLPTIGDLMSHVLTTHFAGHLSQLSQWRRGKGLPALF